MAEREVEKIRKGPWTLEKDTRLTSHVALHGKGRWDFVAKGTGLNRSGRSCRLRWVNYLSPHLKSTDFTEEEQSLIVELHATWGNRWSRIAQRLPGRTDNSIKNYCRTRMKKFSCGIQYGCRVNFQPSTLSSSLPTSSQESNKFSMQSIEEYSAQPCGTISPGAITIPFWDTLDGGQQETASWEEVAESHSTDLSYNVWVESLYAMTLCGFNGDDNRSCTLYNAPSPIDFTNTQFYSDELWNMDEG